MSRHNGFVTQVATREILTRVTHFCSECYNPLDEGETIYYDMQYYCFLCPVCYQEQMEKMGKNEERVREERGATLFG